jgi:hypothetical protein
MENRDKLYNDMKKSEDYVQRINPRHLTPPLAFEELKNMTGDTGVDGNFLVFFYYRYNSFLFRSSLYRVAILFNH